MTSRSITASRFWPEIGSIGEKGVISTDRKRVKPTKACKTLDEDNTLRWLADDIHLGDTLLVGPFDFHVKRFSMQGPKRLALQESHHIADIYWKQLEQRAPVFDISVQTIWHTPT
jgi:hypothetical protein